MHLCVYSCYACVFGRALTETAICLIPVDLYHALSSYQASFSVCAVINSQIDLGDVKGMNSVTIRLGDITETNRTEAPE